MPYVPKLMDQLMAVLQSGRPSVQEMALSAVSSIAAASQGAFQPYAGVYLPGCSCTVLVLLGVDAHSKGLAVLFLYKVACAASQCLLSSCRDRCSVAYGCFGSTAFTNV
jgi:hypothetical protein